MLHVDHRRYLLTALLAGLLAVVLLTGSGTGQALTLLDDVRGSGTVESRHPSTMTLLADGGGSMGSGNRSGSSLLDAERGGGVIGAGG